MDPASLLAIGIVVQAVGGFIMAAAESNGGFLFGVSLAWAGGLVLLVAVISFGVKLGIQAARGAAT